MLGSWLHSEPPRLGIAGNVYDLISLSTSVAFDVTIQLKVNLLPAAWCWYRSTIYFIHYIYWPTNLCLMIKTGSYKADVVIAC